MTRASNETFGAESGMHDDCVLSVSLPVWAGSRPFMLMRERTDLDDVEPLRPRERTAVDLETAALEAAEAEAFKLEGELTGDWFQQRLEQRRRDAELKQAAAEIERNIHDDQWWEGIG